MIRNNNKKFKNKKQKRGGNKQKPSDLDVHTKLGNGNMKVRYENRGLVIPDMFRQKFKYAEQQRNVFATAVNFGSETWAMTDLFAFRTGVSPTIIAGLTNTTGGVNGDAYRMRRYRVMGVKFICRLQNRETVNPITFILHPSQTLPAVASSAEVQWLMEQQSNCIRTAGPLNSGTSTQELRMKYNPEKFFGEQYHEQDEYSGAISVAAAIGALASPTTPLYMGLSFHNANTNTLTTGGAVLTLSVELDVLFYQPDRDEDPQTFKSPDRVQEDLQKQVEDLIRTSRSIKRSTSQ